MDLSNSNQIADAILAALSGKQYLLAVAVALVGAVKGVRWLAPKLHDKTGAFLNSDRGGAILSLIMGVAGGVATSLAAGKPMSLSLILSGIMVSATGSGLFNLTKRISKPNDKSTGNKADVPAAPPPVAPAALVLFLVGLTVLNGCGFCSVAANKDTARCKAQSVATDCGAPEVIKIVTDIAGQVAAALASNDYSKLLDAIAADLVSRGKADGIGIVICTIDHVMSKPAVVAMLSVTAERAKSYKVSHPVKVKAAK